MIRKLCLSLIAATGLAGCNGVGPFYDGIGPDRAVLHWGREPAGLPSRTTSGAVDVAWWRRFRDRELDLLIARTADGNLDLKTAAERVIQGTRQRQVIAAQGLPHLDGQSQTQDTRLSPNGFLRLVEPSPQSRFDFGMFTDGLAASWQLDLFGRVARAVEAADADVLASQEMRNGIALAAIAEMAQDYLTLRGTQTRIRIAERNLALADENVKLVENRVVNGVANTLNLAQARAQSATIAALLPPLRIQEAQLINAMGLLLGLTPRALEGELKTARALPPVPRLVPIGLPGELVRRRPDVRQAEAQLHAAVAQTGVAVANFYPDVTLNGNLSLSSISVASLFVPASRAYTVGPSISLPIFEGGRLRGTLALRKSQEREAAIAFQRTVLNAWREVDDALTAYAQTQRRRQNLAKAVDENKAALVAARQRYIEGASDFLNVISTQATLLQSENDLADADTRIASELVRLYRALGGGWELTPPPPPPPPVLAPAVLGLLSPLCGGPCPEGLNP